MKTYLTLLLLAFTISIQAQKPLDTIYANDQKNVALFFPNPIRQGITGASHFVFTYNREKEQYFGLLQAGLGTDSNLLVVTNDAQVYSYILKYSEKLPKLNYFIGGNESIGTEMPLAEDRQPDKWELDSIAERKQYFKRFCEYLMKSKNGRLVTKRKKGIKLQLQRMVYNGSEAYLTVEISNRSGIDFEVDFLKVYIVNGNKKRKASYQRLEQEVLYRHKMPYSIIKGQSQRFVYVLPKLVLGDNEKLMLELKERNGSRKVVLESIL